jgi:hypothetical protein
MFPRFRACAYLPRFVLVALLASSQALPNPPNEVHQFNVTAEEAVIAIRQFAAQANVHILADGDSLKGKRLKPVAGKLSLDEGLRRLLAGSGLTYRFVGERAIALVTEGKLRVDGKQEAPLAYEERDEKQ